MTKMPSSSRWCASTSEYCWQEAVILQLNARLESANQRMAAAEGQKRAADLTRAQLRNSNDAVRVRERDARGAAGYSGAEARPEHVPRSRPPSPRKRPHAKAGPTDPSADGRRAPPHAGEEVQAEIRQLRAALEEAQRQLRDVRAQMEEAVGQRDAVSRQAEAAARDATRLLQVMAQQAAHTGGHEGHLAAPVKADTLAPAEACQAEALQSERRSEGVDTQKRSSATRFELPEQLLTVRMIGSSVICLRLRMKLQSLPLKHMTRPKPSHSLV